jgi:Ca2+-binding EF-hand superfamily protein
VRLFFGSGTSFGNGWSSPSPLSPVLRGEGSGVRGPASAREPHPPPPNPSPPSTGERGVGWIVLLVLAIPVALTGATPDASHAQRVVLLADSRLVLLDLQVRLDGKPLAAAWRRYLDRLFADLDRDGDGVLNKTEAARAPSVAFLNSFLQGGLSLEAAANVAPFAALDANRDGQVSRQEFDAYYQGCGLDRVQIVPGPDRDEAAALTDTLFALLDRDGDGKLSKEELGRAGEALRRIDLNEDEWITPEELLLHRASRSEKAKTRATLETIGFLPLAPEGLSPAWGRLILARYETRSPFDANRLTGLLAKPAGVELLVRAGKVAAEESASELIKPDKGEAARTRDGGLLVTVPGLALEVQSEKSSGGRVRGLHAFYRQQFEAADADQRGFLERKQVDDQAALAALFPLADRDGDGRLTAKEFDAFLDLHAVGADGFVTLTVTDQSVSLFDLLDENGDGRLSLRELHTAWERLRRFDRDGDGRLARDEFPRRLQLRFTRGVPTPRPAGVARSVPEPKQAKGPAWFRKMDRNGDGYVSRREFLGPEELFKRLDVDGDGLISPEEAEQMPVTPGR